MRRSLATLTSTMLVGMATIVISGVGPASAQVAFPGADFKGYSTGTVTHVDALQLGVTGPQVANTELAFSGAAVASLGSAGPIVNEMDQVVQPALPNTGLDPNLKGNKSFGRGSGLEVGLLNNLPVETNQVILSQRALASAPPSTDLISRQVGPVTLNPVAYASLLRGQAQARWEDNVCILGEPISQGLGYAADAQLVNTGTANADGTFQNPIVAADAANPERSVSQSRSVTRLVPQTNAAGERIGTNFGLMTETRMTIAPVTLFKGTPSATTIEFLGEWVLRAVATGLDNGAFVFYGPGNVTPETPAIRINGDTVLSTQQVTNLIGPILGQAPDTGLVVDVPNVAELALGEDPRAIDGTATSAPDVAADGTRASAAVDVVRVRLLDSAQSPLAGVLQSALDLRIGHIEAKAEVPRGGIRCSLPVSKISDKQTVSAGDSFTYTINVTNPFADCELTSVRIEDLIEVTNGVRYSVTGTNPGGASVTPAANTVTGGNSTIVFNDIGSIPPKGSKSVTISVAIAANSQDGRLTDTAKATGNCATGDASGSARITVPAAGEVRIEAPNVGAGPRAAELPATGADPNQLPRTGGDPMLAMLGLGLLALAAGARRLFTASTR